MYCHRQVQVAIRVGKNHLCIVTFCNKQPDVSNDLLTQGPSAAITAADMLKNHHMLCDAVSLPKRHRANLADRYRTCVFKIVLLSKCCRQISLNSMLKQPCLLSEAVLLPTSCHQNLLERLKKSQEQCRCQQLATKRARRFCLSTHPMRVYHLWIER